MATLKERSGKRRSLPDKTVLNAKKEKAGKAEEFVKVGNVKGKIREEKKLPDEIVFGDNKEKAGKAKEFEKASNLKRKVLVFGEHKIKAKQNVIDYNGRLNNNRKVLGFVENKIEA